MASLHPTTETIQLTSAEGHLRDLAHDAARAGRRILVEEDGTPVAAIVSAQDLRLLERLDAERTVDLALLDEVGAAFADADPEEVEHAAIEAVRAVRAEHRPAS